MRDMREGEVCIYVWRSVKKRGGVEKRTMDTEQESKRAIERESKRQSERKYSSHGEESMCHSERERQTGWRSGVPQTALRGPALVNTQFSKN